MSNPHLAAMITHVTDDSLTEVKKTNKICIEFAAWAREMRNTNSAEDTAEQLKDLDIKSLDAAKQLLNSALALTNIANMFSDPAFADKMLKQFNQMISKHIAALNAVARFTSTGSSKPLPKPPGRSASAAAASPGFFSANPASAASATSKALPPTPKR